MNEPNSPISAYGVIELSHWSLAVVISDRVLKASEVCLLGLEPLGTERIAIRLTSRQAGDLEQALETARHLARRMGGEAETLWLPAAARPLFRLNDDRNFIHPIFGGRDEMRSDDFNPTSKQTMKTLKNALGILETQGLTAALEATDAMLKAADVQLVGKEKIGAAYVIIMIRGDVAAVEAAIAVGENAIGSLGKLIAAHVIARPHDDLYALLPAAPGQALALGN